MNDKYIVMHIQLTIELHKNWNVLCAKANV